jgi:hypothetical protein
VSDANSILNCSLIINNAKVADDTTITKGITQSFARTLANGRYNWSVNCTDSAGNTGKSGIFKLTIAVPSSPSGGKGGGGAAPPYVEPKKNETPAAAAPAEEEKKVSEESGAVEEPEADPVVLSPSTVNPTGNSRSGIIRYWYALLLLPLLLLILWPKGTLIADSGTIEKLISENRIKKYRNIYTLKENCEKHRELKNLVAFELEKKYEWKADLINKTYKLPAELCTDITFALTHYTHRLRKKKIFTMEKIPELYSKEFKKIKFMNLFEEKK